MAQPSAPTYERAIDTLSRRLQQLRFPLFGGLLSQPTVPIKDDKIRTALGLA